MVGRAIFSLLTVVIFHELNIHCLSSNCRQAPRVLILSLDGFRSDYLSPELTPFLHTLSRKGSVGTRMKPMFVTKTFPNHLSIATGLYEESHGVIANNFYDPVFKETFDYNNTESRWWDNGVGLPIWIANEVIASRDYCPRYSGVLEWPGGGSRYSNHLPQYHRVTSIWSVPSLPDTFNQGLEWAKNPKKPANLLVLYHNQPDFTSHDFGPFSSEVKSLLREIDSHMKNFYHQLDRSGLLQGLNMIIISDHGLAEVLQKNIVILSQIVDPSLYMVSGDPPIYGIDPKPGQEDKIYQKLKEFSKKGSIRVYKKQEIPEIFHYRNNRRIMPIIVLAEEGYILCRDEAEARRRFAMKPVLGEHGYDNRLPSMRPLFMAVGPAFREGFVYKEEFENIDIYPLMCKLLDLPTNRLHFNGTLNRIRMVLKDQ